MLSSTNNRPSRKDINLIWEAPGSVSTIFLGSTLDVLQTALFAPLLKFYFLLGLAGYIFDTSDNIGGFPVK